MRKESSNQRPEARLLKFATDEIARRGVRGAEIRHLTKMAGTSTSRFHEFFSCRDNIIVQVFELGWAVIERHVSTRLVSAFPVQDIASLVVAFAEGVLDAFDEDKNAVSATLNLGMLTINDPVRPRLEDSPVFKAYEFISLRALELVPPHIPEADASERLQLLLGGIERRLLLRTPAYAKYERLIPEFNRDAFLRAVRLEVAAFFDNVEEKTCPSS